MPALGEREAERWCTLRVARNMSIGDADLGELWLNLGCTRKSREPCIHVAKALCTIQPLHYHALGTRSSCSPAKKWSELDAV
jgi:hypothetical protein